MWTFVVRASLRVIVVVVVVVVIVVIVVKYTGA